MYNVLISIDDDEDRALASAAAVRNLPGDASEKHITLLYTFTENPSGASAHRIGSVRAAGEFFEEHGVEYDIAERSGDRADEILDVAEEEDADLVVVAGRKRSPAGKAVFGDVTQRVILNSDRPVMVAKMQES